MFDRARVRAGAPSDDADRARRGRDPIGDQPSLVFIRYDSEYLLSQVCESDTEGFALPEESVVPRRPEAQATASDATTVVVAANFK